MKRTILSVAFPLAHVGLDAVGGAEQIVALLDRALVKAGHQSIVTAAEGSRVAGTLVPFLAAPGPIDDAHRDRACQRYQQLIEEVLATYRVDLVHLHGLDFHRYVPGGSVPVLATLHLPPHWYSESIYRMSRENFRMNCVSPSQHRACPASPHLLEAVPNGVDVEGLSGVTGKRDYALTMGRVCPEKGFHLALDAARAAGVELRLAGQVFPYEYHHRYFREEIIPRLDNLRRFIGPLGFRAKRRMLSQAKCLVIPSLAPETSSLVAMEALACGTPVIAFRSGALPDIVEEGRTGFIVENEEEMALAFLLVDRLDPEQCREAARANFSAKLMSARYMDLYEKLIQNQAAAPTAVDAYAA
ncbi:MAG: glycosyl transferase, group 1 [Bryobacterales bacterium]|nr:glycosyl transferase, group 1 [Bryobacterales bacterium]